jgi:hypothetical protein
MYHCCLGVFYCDGKCQEEQWNTGHAKLCRGREGPKELKKKDKEIRKLKEEIESIHERNASTLHTAMENHAAKKSKQKIMQKGVSE